MPRSGDGKSLFYLGVSALAATMLFVVAWVTWAVIHDNEVSRGTTESIVPAAEQFLAETSEQDVPAEHRDKTIARGVVVYTITVRTGPADFMSYDVWRAYVYTNSGERYVVEVTDEAGAPDIASRVQVGDYVAIINGQDQRTTSGNNASDIIVLQANAVDIPDDPRGNN